MAATPVSRKKLMLDYMTRFLRLTYHNLKDGKNDVSSIKIGAVMNDKYGPKTFQLRSLQDDTQQVIADTLNRAQLNKFASVGFVNTIKTARTNVFSQDLSTTRPGAGTVIPTQKTLIAFAGPLDTVGLKEEVQKLRQSGIKIIFFVVEAFTSDQVERQLKPMVSFVRITNKVTTAALSEALNEFSKGILII